MPIVKFTQKDIESSKVLDEGWYPGDIFEVNVGAGKKDPNSITWEMHIRLHESGKELRHWVSSNALFRTKNLVLAVTGRSPEVGDSFDGEDYNGKSMQFHVIQEISTNGNFYNKIDDFMALDGTEDRTPF